MITTGLVEMPQGLSKCLRACRNASGLVEMTKGLSNCRNDEGLVDMTKGSKAYSTDGISVLSVNVNISLFRRLSAQLPCKLILVTSGFPSFEQRILMFRLLGLFPTS